MAGLVIAALVIGAGIYWSMSSNTGEIIKAPERPRATALTQEKLEGQYFSLMHSGQYKVKKIASGGGDLELYDLTASTNYEKHLAISIARLERGLQEYTSYTARELQPSMYAKQALTVDGSPAVLFVKNDTFEKTVFIDKGDKVAVLSFVSSSQVDNLHSEVDALLASFKWKG